MSDLYGPLNEKKRKLTKKPSSEKNLGDWFKRKGAPGKKGGWVDCNTCRKGKCKPCGRSSGEKRSKYPRCRPTPSACKGYKKPKKENVVMDLEQIIREELEAIMNEKEGKEDACYHKVKANSKKWPSALASGRLVQCRDAGAENWGNSQKEMLQIMVEDELLQILEEEKKKTDKERMKCNSPRRIRKGEAGYGKKKFVVKACDGGTEKIIRYGDAKMEIKKDSPERRTSFRARHKCDTEETKDNKLTARHWSCKKW